MQHEPELIHTAAYTVLTSYLFDPLFFNLFTFPNGNIGLFNRMAFPVLLEQEGALLEDDPELIEIDGNGNVVAFRSHPLFLGADTLFATRNGDFVISGPQFTLARMDADFNVLWQDLTLLPQDGQFEFPTEHTVFAETENGDLLVARTVYQVVGENYHDVIVARISSSGEVLFIRNIDGEGNDGFLPE